MSEQIQQWSMAEESVKLNLSGKWVKYADHQQRVSELEGLLREWIFQCDSSSHDISVRINLRKRTDAALGGE